MLLSRSSCDFFENLVTCGAISFEMCAAVREEVLFAGKDKMEEEFFCKSAMCHEEAEESTRN